MTPSALSSLAQAALSDLKAKNITALDVTELTSVTDHMVIASGNSSRHVKALADLVVEKAKESGVRPVGIEGQENSEWILVDLGDVVVHVMLPTTRQLYDLESFWSMNSLPTASNA